MPSDGEVRVQERQAPNLINKLIRFLGRSRVDEALKEYTDSLRCHHGSYGAYYICDRHPWLPALSMFLERVRSGLVVSYGLPIQLKQLAADAYRVSELQRQMPEAVKAVYRRNLLDTANGTSYLLELDCAFHFQTRGCTIQWWGEGPTKRPEFTVTSREPPAVFDVECKRVGVDSFKSIARPDFYRFVDALFPKVSRCGYQGQVDLVIEDRFPHDLRKQGELESSIVSAVAPGATTVPTRGVAGVAKLQLRAGSDEQYDLHEQYHRLWRSKHPDSHIALCLDDRRRNPLRIECRSTKAAKLFDGLHDVLARASKDQLPADRPGILWCSIPEIDDFTCLQEGSLLQKVAISVLLPDTRAHVAAVIFCSDVRLVPDEAGHRLHGQALMYRNPKCRFKELAQFPFITPGA